jgi:hypothetical protein
MGGMLKEANMLSKRAHARRRGTAAIELLMVAPLLGALVILIFFMGWSMVNVLHLQSADRYVAWRHLYGYSDNNPAPIPTKVNQYFMGGSAANVVIDPASAPGGTLASYKARTRADDAEAGDLVDSLTAHAPFGAQHRMSAQFPSNVPLWEKFAAGSYTRRTSGRDGDQWYRCVSNPNAAPGTLPRDRGYPSIGSDIIRLYMTDVQDLTGSIGGDGAAMAQAIRSWYTGGW